MMKIIINIILLVCMEILNANRLPENEATFNRTHIFFRWEQIPKTINYVLYIQNLNDETWLNINTQKNSFLLTEFIDWNLNYEWHVCGNFEDEAEPSCNEIKQFSTHPLPDYYHLYHLQLALQILIYFRQDLYFPQIKVLPVQF